jgi:hypothetical protein
MSSPSEPTALLDTSSEASGRRDREAPVRRGWGGVVHTVDGGIDGVPARGGAVADVSLVPGAEAVLRVPTGQQPNKSHVIYVSPSACRARFKYRTTVATAARGAARVIKEVRARQQLGQGDLLAIGEYLDSRYAADRPATLRFVSTDHNGGSREADHHLSCRAIRPCSTRMAQSSGWRRRVRRSLEKRGSRRGRVVR